MTIEQLLKREQELLSRIAQLEEMLTRAQLQVAWLLKQMFGRGKSERQDAQQLLLDMKEALQAVKKEHEEVRQTIEYERNKPAAQEAQRLLPQERFAHVPVTEVVEVIPEEVKAEPQAYQQIGVEETFEIDIHPPKIFKRAIRRPRFVRLDDRTQPPVLAPAPKRIVDGSYASAGLIAWVVVSKYQDHLPLYRQENIFRRYQADIPRQRLCDWIAVASDMLEIIHCKMKLDIFKSGYIGIDETPVEFMDPDHQTGKTSQGYFHVITAPGRNMVWFQWEKTRNQGIARELVEGFKGVVQCDGNAVYNVLDDMPGIERVACMAHCRRKFIEAKQQAKLKCQFILRLIGRIYAVESDCEQKALKPKLRSLERVRMLTLTLRLLHRTLLKCACGRPDAPLVKASKYMLGQWPDLIKILNLGNVGWDNNPVERAIRPSAIGKKNWLFIGAPDAGKRSAILYSILITCQMLQINQLDYLRDVLKRLPQCTTRDADILPLLPYNWKQSAIIA